jgi:DNA-binding CsgD family transcriptional regulator
VRATSKALGHTLWLGLQNELVRAGICVLVLLGLFVGGAPIWLVLPLPWLTYAGLWLLTGKASGSDTAYRVLSARVVRESYARCLRLRDEITALADGISDREMLATTQQVTLQIDQILDVIAEDEKYPASTSLLDLMTPTRDLLSRYARLVRRGLDGPEVQERVRENLTTLDMAYLGFWKRLNADAIPDLDDLGELIERNLDQMTLPREAPSLPPRLPPEVTRSVPAEIAALISALTPRQLEILRKLTTGATDQEIADMLFIAKRTVTTHLGEIYGKINVRNRAEAVAFAVRWDLTVEPP